jgi:hypothetical protein
VWKDGTLEYSNVVNASVDTTSPISVGASRSPHIKLSAHAGEPVPTLSGPG